MKLVITVLTLVILLSILPNYVLAQNSPVLDNYCKYKKSIDPNFVCPTMPTPVPSGGEAKKYLEQNIPNQQVQNSEVQSQQLPSNNSPNNSQALTFNNSPLWITVVVMIILVIIIGTLKAVGGRALTIPSHIEEGLRTNFRNWDPREFEEIIADVYKKKGYHTSLTPNGPDQGIDIIAENKKEKIVIQAKCWKNKVSNTDVLKTVGAREMVKATKALVITNSDFTRSAFEVQEKTPDLELMNMEKLRDEIKKAYKKSA